MKLLTKAQREKMLHNGRLSASGLIELDPLPVVKLFMPDGGATWLLTELDPDDHDIAFGLCDLGVGSPELGSVRLSEIQSIRGWMGLPVEHDPRFTAYKPLSAYAFAARAVGCIEA